MEPRLLDTASAARKYGFRSERAFTYAAKVRKGFPRPIGVHHSLWDTKAIDLWLDKQAKIETESADDWAKTLDRRLAEDGDVENAIRC